MGPSYTENVEVFKNSDFENIVSLFNVTRRMIGENFVILNVAPSPSWERSTMLNDQAMK